VNRSNAWFACSWCQPSKCRATSVSLPAEALRQAVQHVGRLVDPAALLPCLGIHLLDGFPEAQGSVANRQLRIDRQPSAFTSKSNPFQDCSLSRNPSTTAINSFFPSAWLHQHQDALPVFFEADVEMHAVSPHVHVLLALQR